MNSHLSLFCHVKYSFFLLEIFWPSVGNPLPVIAGEGADRQSVFVNDKDDNRGNVHFCCLGT